MSSGSIMKFISIISLASLILSFKKFKRLLINSYLSFSLSNFLIFFIISIKKLIAIGKVLPIDVCGIFNISSAPLNASGGIIVSFG